MGVRLAFKLVDLVLIKDQKVLNCQSECFNDLASLFSLARGHKLAKLANVQKVAASLREFLAKLLKTCRCAAKVAHNQVRVRIERKRRLFKLETLL